MFDKQTVDLGRVKVGATKKIVYNWQGPGEIISAGAGCGCTIPSFSSSKIEAQYTAQAIPSGIVELPVSKTVWAEVKVGEETTKHYMTFTAIVY
jgi:hypothetical protein